jgi:uncharacterized OB-fold protein
MGVTRPTPRADAVSRGFWEAAERGKLAIQRCAHCDTYQHLPSPLCRTCGSTELAFMPVSGEGRLWGWTVTHHSVLDGFEQVLPYTCMVIELVEQDGLLLLSDLVGREELRDRLIVGMSMHVTFLDQPRGGLVLPQFAPATGSRA